MASWTPVNKKTGVEYPPVNDAERAAMESDPQTKGKYRFKAVSHDAAMPKETPKPTKKEEKTPVFKPIGVDLDEPELPQA